MCNKNIYNVNNITYVFMLDTFILLYRRSTQCEFKLKLHDDFYLP